MFNGTKLHILGSGGAFSTKFGNTQIYIDNGEPINSLLFDCGETFLHNLEKCKFPISNIKHVFLSHMHSDHIGGIASLALLSYFNPTLHKTDLYSPKPVLKNLWKYHLACMLETLEGLRLKKNQDQATIDDFFYTHFIGKNKSFSLDGGDMKYKPIQTIHVVNGSVFMDSYGLSFETVKNKKVLLTGDTQFAPYQLTASYNSADIIVQDCETSPFKSGIHAHIDDLITLPESIKEKMYLIHYGDNIDELSAKTKMFKGVLKQGDVLELDV